MPFLCDSVCEFLTIRISLLPGDVLSGTTSAGIHHAGVLEGWFGEHWWNGRFFVLLVTTLLVFSPLACFKRVGQLCHWLYLAFKDEQFLYDFF